MKREEMQFTFDVKSNQVEQALGNLERLLDDEVESATSGSGAVTGQQVRRRASLLGQNELGDAAAGKRKAAGVRLRKSKR